MTTWWASSIYLICNIHSYRRFLAECARGLLLRWKNLPSWLHHHDLFTTYHTHTRRFKINHSSLPFKEMRKGSSFLSHSSRTWMSHSLYAWLLWLSPTKFSKLDKTTLTVLIFVVISTRKNMMHYYCSSPASRKSRHEHSLFFLLVEEIVRKINISDGRETNRDMIVHSCRGNRRVKDLSMICERQKKKPRKKNIESPHNIHTWITKRLTKDE